MVERVYSAVGLDSLYKADYVSSMNGYLLLSTYDLHVCMVGDTETYGFGVAL